MGVDFAAYTKLRKVEAIPSEDGEALDPETHEPMDGYVWRAYVNDDFPGRAGNIENRAFYEYDECVDGPSFSYGGYSIWRNHLAQLAGWPASTSERQTAHRHSASAWEAKGGVLWELINFADNEGVIGTEACAKIAREMTELQPKVDQDPDDYFRERFAGMRKMFEAAANGGAVNLS